jgi:hypothetical protein
VDTGDRPQNFIRDVDLPSRFSEFPAKRELLERKEALVRERATPPAYLKCDLRTFDLLSLGTQFDAILVDPPWDEYARRATAFGASLKRRPGTLLLSSDSLPAGALSPNRWPRTRGVGLGGDPGAAAGGRG